MSITQKNCIKYSLIGSLIFVAFAFHLDEILVRFLLVGELPGHVSLLSPDAMLAVISVLIILTVAVSVRSLIKAEKPGQKPHLPTRRYQSIQ